MRFFSMAARSRRGRLCVWLTAIGVVGVLGIVIMRDGPTWAPVPVGAFWGLLSAKLVVEVARRRHDAGHGARSVVIVMTALVLAVAVGMWAALLLGFTAVLLVPLAGLFLVPVLSLFAPSAAATNKWGVVPRGTFQLSFGKGAERSGTATAIAIGLVLLGSASGFAGMSWIQGLAETRDRTLRAAEEKPALDSGSGPPLENLEAIYDQQQRRGMKP